MGWRRLAVLATYVRCGPDSRQCLVAVYGYSRDAIGCGAPDCVDGLGHLAFCAIQGPGFR